MKIQPFISSLWEERWDKGVDNKLHTIMPPIDQKYYSGCTNRKMKLLWIAFEYTRLTHSLRMEIHIIPYYVINVKGITS